MSDFNSAFAAVTDKLLQFGRRRLIHVGGVTLYPAEAHMLLAAREGGNFTQIAGHFGVTKGAVSQNMARLERKGLVTVSKDKSSKNAALIKFTDHGVEALRRIDEIRESIGVLVGEILEQFDANERMTIHRFLEHLDSVLGSDQMQLESNR